MGNVGYKVNGHGSVEGGADIFVGQGPPTSLASFATTPTCMSE